MSGEIDVALTKCKIAGTSRSSVFTGEHRGNEDAELGVALVFLHGYLVQAT
jgi:hypothetical protein